MLRLTIEEVDGDSSVIIHAETMKELIDEKLPEWIPRLEDDLPFMKTTKRFQKDPEAEEAKERASGWWYDS